MEINKRQKIIMEFLDKDGFIDKELKFGCLVETDDGVLRINEDTCEYRYVSYYFEEGEAGCDYIFTQNANRMDWGYKLDYKIIGQYQLGDILQWLEKHTIMIKNSFGSKKYECEMHTKDGRYIGHFCIDLSIPPMEYNEEQSKELCSFMESILSYERK